MPDHVMGQRASVGAILRLIGTMLSARGLASPMPLPQERSSGQDTEYLQPSLLSGLEQRHRTGRIQLHSVVFEHKRRLDPCPSARSGPPPRLSATTVHRLGTSEWPGRADLSSV